MNASAPRLGVGLAGRAAPRPRRRKKELWEVGTDPHFPQGTSSKQGPLFPGAGTRFSPQTDPFPASPLHLLQEKGHFQDLYFYIHPRPKSV